MRAFLATVAAVVSLLALTSPFVGRAGADLRPDRVASGAQAPKAVARALDRTLSRGLAAYGSATGGEVVDLNTGQTLFADNANKGRLPASVEKLYTTSTALLRFGPTATLSTTVLGKGYRGRKGNWIGTLYLRGGGDPTFGSISFDHDWYGTGTTMHSLVTALLGATHITGVRGRIVGDESYFDSERGTPATNMQANLYVEGQLSALAYDRGFTNVEGTAFQARPALYATQSFVGALRAAHVNIPSSTPIYTGRTPTGAKVLATVHSPDIATLIQLTNTPSDNFFAEMLLKGIGARFGAGGTTAAGAAVVRAEMASQFGIDPRLDDGSGLSRYDSTTPNQVVTLLEHMAGNATFVGSLAIAGETGTLQDEMQGTVAQGNCRGKTGTLHDVANLVGYCRAADGHTLAFAFMMNSLSNSDAGHAEEDSLAVDVAKYDG